MNLFDQTGKALGSLGSVITASGFKTVDLIILIIYLCLLIFLGLFLGRTKKGEEKSASDYFLAGNTLTWWAVGASLIAANISAEQLIGDGPLFRIHGQGLLFHRLYSFFVRIFVGLLVLYGQRIDPSRTNSNIQTARRSAAAERLVFINGVDCIVLPWAQGQATVIRSLCLLHAYRCWSRFTLLS